MEIVRPNWPPKTREEKTAFMLSTALDCYKTRAERVALRCALGDAASICDGIARDLLQEHRTHKGKGPTSKLGRQLEEIAKRCGDAIWAMREKIDVPRS